MSKYRKIESRLWNDAKFVALSDDGKLVFLLILSHPNMTAVGAMKGSAATLSEDLGWTVQRSEKGLAEVLRKGLVERDQKARLIVLPNFFKYNHPDNPNVLKAWVGSLDQLPECNLKAKVIQRLETLSKGFSEAFQKAFRDTIGKGRRKQEQEQEQLDPEQEGSCSKVSKVVHLGRGGVS